MKNTPQATRAQSTAGSATLTYESVLGALDALGQPAAFYTMNAGLIAQTTALARLVAAEGSDLTLAIQAVVLRVAERHRANGPTGVLCERRGSHFIEGSLCESDGHPSVMVCVLSSRAALG